MKTIRAHKNLHYLTDRLPKSNYDGENEGGIGKASQSGKQKSSSSTNNSLKGLNLPALDRIVLKSNNNKLPVISIGAE